MTKKERIKKATNFIKLYYSISTQEEIAQKLGYTPSYLSELINGKYHLSEKTSNNFESTFEISSDWLLLEEGEMLQKNNTTIQLDERLTTTCNICTEKDKLIKIQRETIEALKEIIEAQKETIYELKKAAEPDADVAGCAAVG